MRSGSRHSARNPNGIAHLCEEMMATTSSLCAKAAVHASVIGARLHLSMHAGDCSGLNVAIETRKVDGSDLANVRHSEDVARGSPPKKRIKIFGTGYIRPVGQCIHGQPAWLGPSSVVPAKRT